MPDLLSFSHIKRTWFYVIYWGFYTVLFSVIQGMPANDLVTAFVNEVISLPPKIIFVHIVLYFLMDKLLFKNRIWEFLFAYLILILVFAVVQRVIDNAIIIPYFLPHWTKMPLLSEPPYLYHVIKLQFLVTVPFSIKLFWYWSVEKNKVQVIESQKMKAELQFLRNQFHPHFLFNVLNSLYSKILNQSGDSSDIVLKISSLLRYSIYEANEPQVKLRKEIGYIKDFIALQQTRFGDRIDVSCTINERTIQDEVIAPFLIIPFIENSFKHCVDEFSGKGWITMNLSLQNNWLTLQIENSKVNEPNRSAQQIQGNSGVGLANVQRRLELLYNDAYTLKINDTEDSYFVLLKIKVNEHARTD